MKNLEKLLERTRELSLRIEMTEKRAIAMRQEGRDLGADFSEMDAHYDRQDLESLLTLISSIEARREEIEEWERVTGLTFDVVTMELPEDDLTTWWTAVTRQDPEVARIWSGR